MTIETRAARARDAGLALLIGAITLCVYLRTLFPGLGGSGDAIKFQFVGSVLGTPHPPGYPLYVVVSWLFSKLPFGVLAWRINFMSAWFGAIAAVLVYWIARALECRRVVATAVALGLAFDVYLWANAVHAEVYSFGAALVAGVVWAAMRWSRTRRRRDLYLTAALFGLSLGNHLTAATLLPAIVVFVIMVDRNVVTWRTIVITAGLVAVGLLQYAFIWIRTLQNAAYLEAKANNLKDLVQVIRASRFSYQIFAFSPREVLLERVPILWRTCEVEFNVLGLIFMICGAAVLLVRMRAVAALLLLGAGGILFLTLNVDADVGGFLVPAFLLLWIVAGYGLETLWRSARDLKAAAVLMFAVTLTLPAWQLTRNFRKNDHHRRDYETRYMNALFARLEDDAVIVREAYDIDHLLYYKLIGERAARGRKIEVLAPEPDRLRPYAARGSSIYAFPRGRLVLEASGFRFAPVNLASSDGTPIDTSSLPLFRLVRVAECRDVGDGMWRDVAPLVASDSRILVRLDDYRPYEATATLFAGFLSPTPDPVLAASRGPRSPRLSAETYEDSRRLRAALDRDGVTDPDALLRTPYVRRMQLAANDEGQSVWAALDLRGKPAALIIKATVDRPHPKRASACGWSGRDMFEGSVEERIPATGPTDILYGMAWHAAERSPQGTDFRWTAGKDAELLVPLARAGAIDVHVRALPFAYRGAGVHELSITVNGIALATQRMVAAWKDYEWKVPANLWAKGFNRLLIRSSTAASPASVSASDDTRTLGVAVSGVTLTLQPDTAR